MHLLCILLFACLSCSSKLSLTSRVRIVLLLFCLFVHSVYHHLFVVVAFAALNFMQLDDRVAGLSSTLFVHIVLRCGIRAALHGFGFDFVWICCTRNVKQ